MSLQCRTLRVSRSGFYAWRGRPESTHAREDRRLGVLVKASFDGSRGRYGSPRVYLDLLDLGVHVSKKRIVRLMQEADLVARRRKRFKAWSVAEKINRFQETSWIDASRPRPRISDGSVTPPNS